ncbi:MAG: hypothetical protein AAF211_14810, partial [Myxococcota bacterium]
NDCDRCELGDDFVDADMDTVADACDVCAGGDDRVDLDGDGTPDDCDRCPGAPDFVDVDLDGVPNGCDACPGSDDALDADNDTVPDGCDVCPTADDTLDADADAVPDGCDACPGADDTLDADFDTVPDGCDRCALGDDRQDADADGFPDACDRCPAGDDALDADGDGVPDACDRCPTGNDALDADGDAVADACDQCPGFDDALDDDGDTVPDDCDVCPAGDDLQDADGDAVPDDCDRCPGFDDAPDADGDGVPDGCDRCPGADDTRDRDADGLPDACDPCPAGPETEDADADGVADACDACPGFDDGLDTDTDTVPDGCDACPGFDDTRDVDLDTVPDDCDVCFGRDDRVDVDNDGFPDGCDRCLGGDDLLDTDGDLVPDACDRCAGFDDSIDVDRDGFPDREPDCDACVGAVQSLAFPSTPQPTVDFLFVVEDTFGSATYQSNLAASFPAFASAIASTDWRIAIITTSAPNLVGPVITPGAGAQAAFASQVMVGESGGFQIQAIQQAYDATQPGGAAGPGSTFLRTGASLVVVFVTDGFDQSTTMGSTALSYWQGLKNNDPSRVGVHGVVSQFFNSPLSDLITSAGGLSFDIFAIQNTYGPELQLVSQTVVPDLVLPLPSVPVLSTIVVREDGVITTDGVFESPTNTVRFSGSTLPAPSSTVTIDYIEDCEGVIDGCQDGVDNDGDGLVDYPDDPGCAVGSDANEVDPFDAPSCADGLDNDGDGTADFPADPECDAASQDTESCGTVGRDGFGYRACRELAVGVCPDLSATPNRLPLGDEGTVEVPLGFAFDFYGIRHSSVYVGANGTLSFTSPWSPSANQCLDPTVQRDTILVWWDDLNPAGGDVWVRTAGFAPARTFEVQWRAPHFSGSRIDVRAVLHEDTGDIDFCYVDALSGAGISSGASATSGIRGRDATFIETSCFDPTLTQGSVLRFEHP